jgi:hypothetical protein
MTFVFALFILIATILMDSAAAEISADPTLGPPCEAHPALQDITNVQHADSWVAMPPLPRRGTEPFYERIRRLEHIPKEDLQNAVARFQKAGIPMTSAARACKNKVIDSWERFLRCQNYEFVESPLIYFLYILTYSSTTIESTLGYSKDGSRSRFGSAVARMLAPNFLHPRLQMISAYSADICREYSRTKSQSSKNFFSRNSRKKSSRRSGRKRQPVNSNPRDLQARN